MKFIRYIITGDGRHLFKKIYKKTIHFYFKLIKHSPTNTPCIVFAPHQDDETLGCGGTIIKKLMIGAPVKIVYMTDGNNSHKHLRIDLKDIRKKEALAACKILGIDESDIYFLDFVDGLLDDDYDKAVKEVSKLLREHHPDEIYIPHIKDHHPDHKATNRIVINALRTIGKSTTVFEYPTWFWRHWPIVSVKATRKKHYLEHIKLTLRSATSMIFELRYSVNIRDVLALKKDALYKHESQLIKKDNNKDWVVLGDVSDGEWLECFFQNYEIFHRYTIS